MNEPSAGPAHSHNVPGTKSLIGVRIGRFLAGGQDASAQQIDYHGLTRCGPTRTELPLGVRELGPSFGAIRRPDKTLRMADSKRRSWPRIGVSPKR